jgi:CII-binding regulator of phage lambda lysogenization HflD
MSTQDKSQIRRYLSNQMNVEEKFNFELEMLNNPKLKKEVVLMKAAIEDDEENCCACQTSYWKARIHEKFGYTSEAIKYYEAPLALKGICQSYWP